MSYSFDQALSVNRDAETEFSGEPCVEWSGEFVLWSDFLRVLAWVHDLNSDSVFLFASGSVEEQLGGSNNGNMAYGFRIEFEEAEEADAFEAWVVQAAREPDAVARICVDPSAHNAARDG